jgi:hypothetical protein
MPYVKQADFCLALNHAHQVTFGRALKVNGSTSSSFVEVAVCCVIVTVAAVVLPDMTSFRALKLGGDEDSLLTGCLTADVTAI